MSLNEIITKLTPEQEALIPVYRESGEKLHFQLRELIEKKRLKR
ncbi:hypothetical protein [Tolypothrix sp. VBCCA 56010]